MTAAQMASQAGWPAWLTAAWAAGTVYTDPNTSGRLALRTPLDGDRIATDDWVFKDTTGALYALNPTEVALTYEDSNVGGSLTLAQVYPVGSVYVSVVPTSPATLFGMGTWMAFGAGRVLVGVDAADPDFDTVEETRGAKTVAAVGTNSAPTFTGDVLSPHSHSYSQVITHTHSVSVNDPGHTHLTQRYPTATGGSTGFTIDVSMSGTLADNTLPTKAAVTGITASTTAPAGAVATGTTAVTGAGTPTGTVAAPAFTGTPTSVVQPSLVVYMWKRVA